MTVTGKVIGLTALILVFAGAVMIGGLYFNSADKPALEAEHSVTSTGLVIENGTSTPGKFLIEENQEIGF